MRGMNTARFSLAFVVDGALPFAGASAGLYWIAADDIRCVVAIVLSALGRRCRDFALRRRRSAYVICSSRCAALEMSASPGFGSILSSFTTPSSTSIA